jgi:threonine/homoserine/homoserine lactone efflux protein
MSTGDLMAVGSVAAFWLVSFMLVLVPGADWAYAIAAGMSDRTVLPAVSGLLAGYVALTVVVAAGLATIVAGSPVILTVLTAVGALYLLWLGISTLRHPPTPRADTGQAPGSWVRRAAKGAGISGLNPKALLLFVALLPQFIVRGAAWPFAVQIALLGLVHIANCGAVYMGVGATARRVLRSRPSAARAVSRTSGAAMILISALLVAEHFTTAMH